jgi:excisionase family DNA binding protein
VNSIEQIRRPGQFHLPQEAAAVQEGSGRLMNIREAAAFLGVSCGTLYHWVASPQRGVPCVRLGRRCLRFRRSDLDRWIAEQSLRDFGNAVTERTSKSSNKEKGNESLRRNVGS